MSSAGKGPEEEQEVGRALEQVQSGKVEPGALLDGDVRWRGADGKLRSRTLRLTPGWHTVWLGQEASEGG